MNDGVVYWSKKLFLLKRYIFSFITDYISSNDYISFNDDRLWLVFISKIFIFNTTSSIFSSFFWVHILKFQNFAFFVFILKTIKTYHSHRRSQIPICLLFIVWPFVKSSLSPLLTPSSRQKIVQISLNLCILYFCCCC